MTNNTSKRHKSYTDYTKQGDSIVTKRIQEDERRRQMQHQKDFTENRTNDFERFSGSRSEKTSARTEGSTSFSEPSQPSGQGQPRSSFTKASEPGAQYVPFSSPAEAAPEEIRENLSFQPGETSPFSSMDPVTVKRVLRKKSEKKHINVEMKKADAESEEKLVRADASERKKAKTESLDGNSDEGSKEKPRSQKRVASKEKLDPEKEDTSGKYHRRKKAEPKLEKKADAEAHSSKKGVESSLGKKTSKRQRTFEERSSSDEKLKKIDRKEKEIKKNVPKKKELAKGAKILERTSAQTGRSIKKENLDDNEGANVLSRSADVSAAGMRGVHKQAVRYQKKAPKRMQHLEEKKRRRVSKVEYLHQRDLMKEEASYQQKSALKKFFKRRQMKAAIYKKNQTHLRDRIKNQLQNVAKKAAQVVTRKAKWFALIVGGLLLIMLLLMGGSFLGGAILNFGGGHITVSSYESSKPALIRADGEMKQKIENLLYEAANLEAMHPDYDYYRVNIEEGINLKIDTHQLLAYLTAKYGKLDLHPEAYEELEELLNEIYDVKREEEERTVHETRYYDESGREVNWSAWDPNTGVSQDDTYTERGFIFSISKKKEPMEVFKARLEALDHPDERKKHFATVLRYKGNMPELTGEGIYEGERRASWRKNGRRVPGGNFQPWVDGFAGHESNTAAFGQCVWYVKERLFQTQGIDILEQGLGDGRDIARNAEAFQDKFPGWSRDNPIKAGGIVSWQEGTWGHVAFVENVSPTGVVTISEMNIKGNFVRSGRTFTVQELRSQAEICSPP